MGFLRKKNQPPARRQRLLSESNPQTKAFTYHARRDQRPEATGRQLSSDEAAITRRRSNPRHGVLLGLTALVALIVAGVLISLSTTPIVMPLTEGDTPLQLHTTAAYQAAAQMALKQSIWNHTKVTLQTESVQAAMLKQFPELDSVTVTVPFFGRTPVVYIEHAKPALFLAATNGTFILDTHGKALAMQANALKQAHLDLPTVTDQSSLRVSLNKTVLTPNNVSFIQIVLSQLKAKQISYTTLVLPPSASELDVSVNGQPYYVKFNLANNTPKQQAGTFLAAQQELKRQNITPAKYIDVRVEGRAYYQ